MRKFFEKLFGTKVKNSVDYGFEYENGWDDLKGDPRWINFYEREPEIGQKVMMTYFKGTEPRNYKVKKYDPNESIMITHWYPVE